MGLLSKMPSITHFEISIDPHPYFDIETGQVYLTKLPVYRPGDWVCGHLLILMNKKAKTRGVRLACQGSEFVHITRQKTSGHGKRRKTRTKHYYGRNWFVNERPTLMGRPKGQGSSDDDVYLVENLQYAFPFQFQIPLNALPSFIFSDRRNIKYGLYANVDRPWKFDYETFCNLQVLPSLYFDPLNLGPNCVKDSVKRKYLGMFNAGEMEYTIEVQRNMVAVGDLIPVKVALNVQNLKAKILKVSAKLQVHGEFRAQSQCDYSKEISGKAKCKYSKDCNEYLLQVPVNRPKRSAPFSMSGQYITFRYELKVEIHFEFLVSNINHYFDIQVYPAKSTCQSLVPMPVVADSSTMEQAAPIQEVESNAQPRIIVPNYPRENDQFEAPLVEHKYWPESPPPPYAAPNSRDVEFAKNAN